MSTVCLPGAAQQALHLLTHFMLGTTPGVKYGEARTIQKKVERSYITVAKMYSLLSGKTESELNFIKIPKFFLLIAKLLRKTDGTNEDRNEGMNDFCHSFCWGSVKPGNLFLRVNESTLFRWPSAYR